MGPPNVLLSLIVFSVYPIEFIGHMEVTRTVSTYARCFHFTSLPCLHVKVIPVIKIQKLCHLTELYIQSLKLGHSGRYQEM